MKKNVAIIVQTLSGGGTERVASNLSLNLSNHKYYMYITIYYNDGMAYRYGGELINLNIKLRLNPVGKFIAFIQRFFKILAMKKRYNIDTAISLSSSPNILNIFTKKNDRVIISVRNYISKSYKGFYGTVSKLSIRYLYNKADIIIAVSKAIKNDLITNYAIKENKIRVIYNPYDIEKIKNFARENLDDKDLHIFDKPTIITMGTLTRKKGQWHLIRAFKKAKESLPDAQLVVLGQGELKGYLSQLAIDLGIKKDVHFLGFRENPFKLIANSQAFVLPSLYEGFPNALCEAMACCIPVIASDCKSGPREILAPDTSIDNEARNIEYERYGILVPLCDGTMYGCDDSLTVEELCMSQALVAVLRSQLIADTYSQQAIIRANDFNMKNIIRDWEDLI